MGSQNDRQHEIVEIPSKGQSRRFVESIKDHPFVCVVFEEDREVIFVRGNEEAWNLLAALVDRKEQ